MGNTCRDDLRCLLERIKDTDEQVNIIIQSGEDCCEFTGCICEVDDCFVVLIDTKRGTCIRTYILLDCICALVHPAQQSCCDEY